MTSSAHLQSRKRFSKLGLTKHVVLSLLLSYLRLLWVSLASKKDRGGIEPGTGRGGGADGPGVGGGESGDGRVGRGCLLIYQLFGGGRGVVIDISII